MSVRLAQIAVAAITVLAISACGGPNSIPLVGPADAANPAPLEDAVYRVGAGDEIRVIVYGEDDLSGEYTVDGSGVVSMPLLGQVQVGGLTLRELETKLMTSLDANYLRNPRVSAEVLNFRPFYIIGEVLQGGEYPYQDGMSVLNAVAIAGGFTFRARSRGITINRGTETIEVHNPAVEPVMPGDVIRIPERFF